MSDKSDKKPNAVRSRQRGRSRWEGGREGSEPRSFNLQTRASLSLFPRALREEGEDGARLERRGRREWKKDGGFFEMEIHPSPSLALGPSISTFPFPIRSPSPRQTFARGGAPGMATMVLAYLCTDLPRHPIHTNATTCQPRSKRIQMERDRRAGEGGIPRGRGRGRSNVYCWQQTDR